MGIRWRHLLLALAAGSISWWLGSVAFWANMRTPILSILSILAAAIFVRIARGVAVGPIDAITVDKARSIASAMQKVARVLRALLLVIIATMVMMIFAEKLVAVWQHLLPERTAGKAFLDSLLSGALGFLLTFVCVRVMTVIQSDIEITDIQAENLILAAAKKQGDKTDSSIKESKVVAETSRQGYGRIIQ